MVSEVGGKLGTIAFFRLLLCLGMTCNEHELLTMFLKIKSPVFKGFECEDPCEFILNCYERHHKLGILH